MRVNRGDTVLWHAVRGDKIVDVVVTEGDIITVRDSDGVLWLVNIGDIEVCHG